MTVDARGRSAADSLLHATHTDLEARVMLGHLHETRTTWVRSRTVALTVLVALVFIIATFGWVAVRPHASAPPISQVPHHAQNRAFALAVPFTADLPDGWWEGGHPGVTATLNSPTTPFVEVVIDPHPIRVVGAAGGAADPTPVSLSAQSLAGWMANLPYLEPTSVVPTTLSGLPAWQVDIRLRVAATATQQCDNGSEGCMPMIRVPSVALPLGPSHGGVARVIFVAMPDGRIVGVVASGAAADNLTGLLADTQPILDSIKFDATR